MNAVKRTLRRNLLIAATCCLSLCSPRDMSAQSSGEQVLLGKAQTLASKGHLEMAVQTWQQVLLADPNNHEALLGIAKADMQLGKTDEARKYLDRLRAAGGSPAEIAKIQAMPNVASKNERLSQAASLAQAGRYADAMRIYRDVLGNNPPAGNDALAYYDTEAAIPEDRPHAVAGLRKLAEQFPADSRYSITLGRVLTYDPKTRAEGIAILQKYDSVPSAQSALKQAEGWNAAAANAAAAAPPVQTPAPKTAAPAGNPLEASAYRALNSGRLDDARRQFEQLLAREPNNPRALSGMGYVYMKQQDFTDAADYLERARAAGARGLDSALSTSRFWEKMAEAGNDLKLGNSESAIEAFNAALAMKPGNADALEGLGGAYAQAGNHSEAMDTFERAVRVSPDRQGAWRGLFLAQSAAGDAQGALATSDRMPKNVRAALNSDPEYLHALAQTYLTLGRKSDADRTIERALALPFPNEGRDLPPEKQMQYASLLMMANRYEPALQLYQQVVAQDPENAGAWRALIAAEHQLNRDNEALATVGRMPQALLEKEQNDPAFLVLVGSIYQSQHAWDRAQKYLEQALAIAPPPQAGIELQLADIYAAQGNQQKAYTIFRQELDRNPQNQDAWRGVVNALHQGNHDREAMRQIAAMPESVRLRLEQDPSYLQTLASVQASIGQSQAAMKTFSRLTQIYRDRNMDEPVAVQIQYGWLLLKLGDDQRLYSLVSGLSTSPDMTDDQQADFNRLMASWSVRRANSASAAGDQNRALAILNAAAQAFPGNEEVYGALAGIYLKAGQPRQAVAIYASLDMSHATSQLYESAIGAALAARDMKQAQTWLESALDEYKDNPALLREAAQYEQARGNSQRAAAYYQAALNAMGSAAPGAIFTQPGDVNAPGSLSPAQQLMQLLAPTGRTARQNQPEDFSESSNPTDVSWLDAPAKPVPTLGEYAQARDEGSNSRLGDYARIPDDNRALPPPETQYAPPAQAYARHRSSPVVEQAQVAAPVDYLQPVTMKVPPRPSASSQAGSSSSARLSDISDPNPASRLQSAVRQMNGQVQAPDSGLPPVEQAPPALPLLTQPETAKAEAPALPPLTGPGAHVVRAKTPREQIEDQLAIIRGASSPWVGGSSGVEYRSGQPGYDRLAAYTEQIEASSMLGPDVRATIITRPVLLDSGEATTSTTFQQGTLPADAVPYLQSAAGIGGEFQLRAPSFAASLGYTPHGFLVENVTGGIYVHPPTSHFTLTFGRDPITDTQLSYAGLRDLGSKGPTYIGNTWGGVVTNAGELQLAFGGPQAGWYIQGGGQYITGQHVQTNKRIDGDAGAYWSVLHHPDYGTLQVGMNFFGMHYDHNLRYFTYGQGGYFSPAAYILAGVPFTFNGHHGPRFHYRATGSIGLQAFQENSTPYYPLDPTIQFARNNPYYPEKTAVGGNYTFEGEGAYAIAEHWYVGGYLSFNNTRDYASNKGGFYVRYLFRPQPMLEENGPTGLFPLQGMRPLQVP